MKESIEAMLWDFIVDNNIATEDEVRLVSDINGLNEEREYLEEWYFEAFGTYNIKYNFSNELEEIHSMMEEAYEEA